MQHTLTSPPLGSSDLESSPAFNVVIAYEDFETGKHAKKTYDFLVENLGHDCHFTNQMWKFEVLSIPKLREIAVKDAAMGDIIIISCHGDELPPHVKTWIESWLAMPGNPLALVALFDPAQNDPGQSRAARAYLEDVARRGRMEFFAQPDAPLEHHRHHLFPAAGKPEFNDKALSTLAGVVQRETYIPRWGINE